MATGGGIVLYLLATASPTGAKGRGRAVGRQGGGKEREIRRFREGGLEWNGLRV